MCTVGGVTKEWGRRLQESPGPGQDDVARGTASEDEARMPIETQPKMMLKVICLDIRGLL
jgi:hypothetical protein